MNCSIKKAIGLAITEWKTKQDKRQARKPHSAQESIIKTVFKKTRNLINRSNNPLVKITRQAVGQVKLILK